MTGTKTINQGGRFLIEEGDPARAFTPERLSEEQVLIGRTARAFVGERVWPHLAELESGGHALTTELLREAGSLGMLGAFVPQEYGGAGLNMAGVGHLLESLSRGASFAISIAAHAGIGTLPLVLFGSPELKARYLPSLATGQRLASYALTEPDAGSDAMGIKTLATLSPDGRFYILNGQKQWITNSGFADVFTVYAKVDGEKITAFLVERELPGVSVGPEAKKMGLHGSSTCSVYLSDVRVPVENVVGEVGRGHVIAFTVLDVSRWMLAAGCLGTCKDLLALSARYAAQRVQFGKPIGQFPAIQQKLAQMAARTFALESMAYRTAGLIDAHLETLDKDDWAGRARALGEYAVEASINKVYGSETLDYVADEAVQIHGGFGFMQECEAERAYRDARIERIFEGTNEINRMLIPGTLLRKTLRGELPLMEAIERAQREVMDTRMAGPDGGMGGDGALRRMEGELANLKRTALLLSGIGAQKYLTALEEQQELLLALADLVIGIYAWESALLRTRALVQQRGPQEAAHALDLAQLVGNLVMDQSEATARRALAGMQEGDTLQTQLAVVRRLFRRTPANEVEVGRRVAQRVLAGGGYAIVAGAASEATPAR